ncbi:MAG: ThiF family adenylyltransferase [Actinobacteria bacterium]|nr:ThiF family adenylyltransferase [Actinomycetota bacterium]MBW3648677.1 ThiF family adenylyltransferase [Actinomycetota bacterium]
MRPVLTPFARRLWRDPATLQLGHDTARATVLAGVDAGTRAALVLLDGTRDRAQLLSAGAAVGCPAERMVSLLALLGEAGLLEDAGEDRSVLRELDPAERDRLGADLGSLALVRGDGGLPAARHRRSTRVLVVGAGRVGAPLAAMLGTAGIGAVDVVDDSTTRPEDTGVGGLDLADVGRSRGEAARERLRRAAPSLGSSGSVAPDLVVLAPGRAEQLEDARRLVGHGVPHLLAQVRGTVGVVGPLVLPGLSACLTCLDLTRTDLDPQWPSVAAQLAGPSRCRDVCDGPLAVMVAAQAVAQVLLLVDGTMDPASVGGTLELALPDWRWRRRSWPVHPACRCALSAAG